MMVDDPARVIGSGLRIEVAVGNALDHELLARSLGTEGYAIEGFDAEGTAGREADLLIVDSSSLNRLRQRIDQLHTEASPVVFPVLLLTKNELTSPTRIGRELGTAAADILRIPTTRAELSARVRNLLRLRQLSLQQFHEYKLMREVTLQETTEQGLAEAVCRIITGFKGYAAAWVGTTDPDQLLPKLLANGTGSDIDAFVAAWNDDGATWHGLLSWALASGEPQVVADLATSLGLAPWRAQLRDLGLESMITLPLRPQHGEAGVLMVSACQPGAFGQDAQWLLERLSTHLTFGLDKLRMQCEQKRQQQEIHRLAYRDPLTDLPNRRFLLQRLNQLMASTDGGQQAAVLFLDLNDFKLVNDALGHAAGDQILRRAARRIQHTLRDGDLVGRQGGDEFIVVLIDNPRTPLASEEDDMRRLAAGAEALASRIIKALEQPFAIQGHRHHLSVSIGISLLPCGATLPEEVIDQADMAMYQAKKQGHRLMFYSSSMEQHRLVRLSLESRLYHALESEEFHLHYQPIWEIGSGRLIGVEALLRWTDAEGNRISPGEFIPVAEDLRLMEPLGDWVLKTAARQLANWRARGITLFMAVNLSVSQLRGRQAAMHIHDLAVAEATQPGWWHLELTEDTLMHEPEEVEEAMNVLSDCGFHLALDDFGRGYSSLARLQSMPLDILKIDKLFVDRLEGDATGEPIVQAILDLAHHLSIHVVAEGIETSEQRNRLSALGCHWGQGFLVSGARSAGEIEAMVIGNSQERVFPGQ